MQSNFSCHTPVLQADKIDVRLKAVNLLGGLFSLSGHAIAEMFQPLFVEFLKRITDRVVEIRISVIEHAKNCLLSDLSRPEAPDIISKYLFFPILSFKITEALSDDFELIILIRGSI